jgi:hypothetical protein
MNNFFFIKSNTHCITIIIDGIDKIFRHPLTLFVII